MNHGVQSEGGVAELVRDKGGPAHYLVCNRYLETFRSEWFSSSHWGVALESVSKGGRGSAWFIDDGQRSWVLRQYLRGGIASRISADRFLFLGEKKVRSFYELDLLQELFDEGLPVPEPVAASYTRSGASYSACILINRIEAASTMGEQFSDLEPSVWRSVGSVIRRFHDNGVYHADLNCFNILVSPDAVYLIDFDKCRRHPPSRENAPWKTNNLERLKRSIDKITPPEMSQKTTTDWQQLLSAYYTY
jgi:3-deoxy-D-manno-octulosonic acid kinase